MLYYDAATGRSPPTTAARPRPRARRPTCSWTRTASRSAPGRRRAVGPLDRRARRGRHAGAAPRRTTASCREDACSARRDRAGRRRASRSPRAWPASPTAPRAGGGHRDCGRYFTKPDGSPMQAGDTLRRTRPTPATLRRDRAGPERAARGAARRGDRRQDGSEPLPGTLTLDDLDAYQPQDDARPLCRPYRVYVRLRAAAAVGRASALLQVLGMLERTDIAERGPTDRRPGSCSPRPAG